LIINFGSGDNMRTNTNGRREETLSADSKFRGLERAAKGKKLYIGIDIGSISSDVAVVDEAGKLLYSDYRRTMGGALETIRGQLGELMPVLEDFDVRLTAVTGSAGRFFAELMGLEFVNEVPAQAACISRLYPDIEQASVIEMGGQDSKLMMLAVEDGQIMLKDFALNTGCAAGTGSFLDQQADRLGVDIEGQFGELALESKSVPRMAGRCSVFAKSDMIHLQQQATPVCDIIAGLCLALARNLRSNLGKGRQWARPVIFTGGVAANAGVVKAIETALDLKEGEVVVPDEHFFTGAMGAVFVAKARAGEGGDNGQIDLDKIDDYLQRRGTSLQRAPRRQMLVRPSVPAPKSKVYSESLEQAKEPVKAYIGVDVGSISTNVVVMDQQKRVLAKAYLMTAGKPLEAVRQGIEQVSKVTAGKVEIVGAATTGSGRYLTGDFVGADIVINEITAQAAGAAIVRPDVDTIFEIGGQDSKYISLENGVVVDFEMNHACAAGTGSFLEEQAQRLDISIKGEFAERAFGSESPIKLGERCTVFMESDLLSYQQQGAATEDLVAGLAYSIVSNYLNRVVGRRKVGDKICFQGGTAFNRAVVAAFEQVVGKEIVVPDHHEVTGALGAASIAAEHMNKLRQQSGKAPKSAFRGIESLAKAEYKVESFECEHCSNHCKIKKVDIPGSDPLYYGSRCDMYNLKKKKEKSEGIGAFEFRRDKMMECAGLGKEDKNPSVAKGRVGIPMSLVSWQLMPMFSRFFQELGYEVVPSKWTGRKTIRRGVEKVTAQTCFPVKVAYGHVAELLDKNVDYLFVPSVVSMTKSFDENEHNQLCPYVQSFGFQVQTAFADELGQTKVLSLPIRLGEGQKLIQRSFGALKDELGISGGEVKRALKVAFEAQDSFEAALKAKGKEILDSIGEGDRLFVLVSRPYNGCDDGVNLELPRKLADIGVKVIPLEMLELGKVPLSDEVLHESVYWSYGQKILRAAELIKADPRLFAIYLSNFSCGPDSFIQTFFKEIMADKPCLQLEIDEHSADAGVITRLEAFMESLRNYRPGREEAPTVKQEVGAGQAIGKERTLYIPYMGDSSYSLAAGFRGYGQPAEVIPMADEEALVHGRAYTTGKECLPCAITTGDMLKVMEREDFDPKKAAFFMPGSSGPCRFGMYNSMHRLVLHYVGSPEVPVISPNQDSRFYEDLGKSVKGGSMKLMKDLWAAVVGIDLLYKAILKVRPFAVDRQAAQDVYDKCLKRWEQVLEGRPSFNELLDLMERCGAELENLELDYNTKKPRIGIVGEIYVRSHPFANLNLIEQLEGLGAQVDLASLAEWIYYTNYTRKLSAWRRGEYRSWFNNVLQNSFQKRMERQLAEPLEKRFGHMAEHDVEEVIDIARPYIDPAFEGEAILSIGKMIEMHEQGIGGVINVMPFSCMPSTIVSTQTMRIAEQCHDMPILNLSFDGQEDPILLTELEAFIEQVRQRQYGVVTANELMTTA